MYKNYKQIGHSQTKDKNVIQMKATRVSTGRWTAKQNPYNGILFGL